MSDELELERLRAENARLRRLVATNRPELSALRDAECLIRALCQSVPDRLLEAHTRLAALLPGNADDLPTTAELRGLFGAKDDDL